MTLNRRKALCLGTLAAAGFGLAPSAWMSALAQGTGMSTDNMIMGANGDIGVMPVNHASLAIAGAGQILYIDPVGDAGAYADLPKPDYILITHEHRDHYNADTLHALVGETTKLVANPSVFDKLPDDLRTKTTKMANGQSQELDQVTIDAIPAYNTTAGRLQYHPEGRDNGYIVTLDGKRIYIAGDTEDIPEMRALTNIDVAFIPMITPFTMDINQAANGVLAFAPKIVYPYHYGGSDTGAFKALVVAANNDIEVRLHDWYGA